MKTLISCAIAILLVACGFFIWKHYHNNPASSSIAEKIVIQGDAECVSKTTAALNLLKQKSPDGYSEVESYIGIIQCQPSGSGMYAMEKPPRFVVGNQTRDAGVIWYAGAIVHDSNHSKLYNQYLTAHPGIPVPADVWTGQAAENQCIAVQYKALEDLGADAATLKYLQSQTNSNYWQQENRTW